MPPKTAAFLSYGFRPFFLFAGIYAVIAMAAWIAWFGWNGESAWVHAPATDFPPLLWHTHEMLFGYAIATLAGFLLTAAPNWTGAQPVNGGPLALLAGVWAAGRAAVWFSAFLPPGAVAAVDLAFPALLLTFMARTLTGGSARHAVFLGVLALLFAANGMVHLERLGLSDDTAAAGHRLAFDVFIVLIALIGGRVVPAFTRSVLAGKDGADPLPPLPWLDRLAVFSVLAVLVADQLGPNQPVAGGLALGAAAINGLRLIRWQGWHVLDQPIVWILHLGYAWLVAGLAFKGFAQLSGAVDGATALHVLSVGAIGSMTLGIMTRAGLGHTGRALKVAPAITFAYLLLSGVVVVRIGGPMWLEDFRQAAMVTAGAGWCVAFAVFTRVYWPILTGPHVDEI
jgi:uncharacterized protein involved in response to NO